MKVVDENLLPFFVVLILITFTLINQEMFAVYIAVAIAIILKAWGRFKIDSVIAERMKKAPCKKR